MGRPAAIFDVDGTLLDGTSAERLFVLRALRRGTLSPSRLAVGGVLAFAAWSIRRASTPFEFKAYLRGLDCERAMALGVDCVDADVAPRLRASLLCELEAHRQGGFCIVLLSGTLDFLGTEIARLVGADVVEAAHLERRGGRFTGRVLAPYPHGNGKVRVLEGLARRLDLDLAASHAYANRASDAPHLERVGFAHAVAPDRSLRRLASRHGWSIHAEVPPAGRPA